MWEAYEDAAAAWFCKRKFSSYKIFMLFKLNHNYIDGIICVDGDIGPRPDVKDAFMKQKHRMVWERRHGPVGSGMKQPDNVVI